MLRPIGEAAYSPARQTLRQEAAELYKVSSEQGHATGYQGGYDRGEAAGRQAGQAAGYQEALQKFEEDQAGVLEAYQSDLAHLIKETQRNLDTWYVHAETKLADLALEIARAAIQQELAGGRESVLTITQETLKRVRRGTQVRIRVNPQDVAVLEGHKASFLASLAQIRDIEIVADPETEAGVILETEDGLIDARIETFLDRLTQTSIAEAA